jgi:hypothetical protein
MLSMCGRMTIVSAIRAQLTKFALWFLFITALQMLRDGVDVRRRDYRFRTFDDCFIGSGAFDLLIREFSITEDAASIIGK